jgi:hypothetical protein
LQLAQQLAVLVRVTLACAYLERVEHSERYGDPFFYNIRVSFCVRLGVALNFRLAQLVRVRVWERAGIRLCNIFQLTDKLWDGVSECFGFPAANVKHASQLEPRTFSLELCVAERVFLLFAKHPPILLRFVIHWAYFKHGEHGERDGNPAPYSVWDSFSVRLGVALDGRLAQPLGLRVEEHAFLCVRVAVEHRHSLRVGHPERVIVAFFDCVGNHHQREQHNA